MKLGDKGPKYDHLGRTLKLGDFIAPTLAYPEACDLTEGLASDEDDLGNTSIGLCALAAPAHKVRWLDQLRRVPPRVDTDKVVAQYSALTGYVPGDDSTDNGTYALDVFRTWRKSGLFGLPPVTAFAQVNYLDAEEVAKATFLAGGVFLCLSLPKRVRDGDPRDVDVWDVPLGGDFGGELGGHMVWLHGSCCNSWGRQIVVTPELIAARTYDAFVAFGEDDLLPGGRAFSGLDLAGLRAAVAAVTG
jgi:hypothetical protein